MSTVILTEPCPYCRKARSPLEIMRLSSFVICHDCYQRHLKALDGLGNGKYTGECSECGKSVEEIRILQGDGDRGVRMVVHFENGIYRPMCIACDARYVPLRRDLYGGTEFWQQKGL